MTLPPEEQRQHTLHAMQAAGLTVQELWIHYFALSGDADEFDLDAYLHGVAPLQQLDRDLVSHAVNELIAQTPPPTAPYSEEL
ncbi:hypothetical protein ACX80I_15870 [Arthrobacter sp. MDT3-44]